MKNTQKSSLEGKSILVTGGTGSFGKTFISTLMRDHPEVRRIVV
ncbi:MAG: polysaccharide biosynthesis protein, partial [Gammaproteobacteria bacterium]